MRADSTDCSEAVVNDFIERTSNVAVADETAGLDSVDRLLAVSYVKQVSVAPTETSARVQAKQGRQRTSRANRQQEFEGTGTVGHKPDPRGEVAQYGILKDLLDGQVTPDGYVVNTSYSVNAPHPSMTAAANLVQHARRGTVKWRCAAVFAAAGVVGAFVGSSLSKLVDGQRLLLGFALLMFVVGASMLRRRKSEVLDQLPPRLEQTLFVPMTEPQIRLHDENKEIAA